MVVGVFVLAAAIVLAVAGVAKLRSPRPAAVTIRTVVPWIRSVDTARVAARVVGVVEIAAACAVLVLGTRWTLTVLACCYLTLLLVAILLMRRRVPCGCFGTADATIGAGHLLLDGAGVAVATWGAVSGTHGVGAVFGEGAPVGIALVLQAILLAALACLAVTTLPALVAARRSVEVAT